MTTTVKIRSLHRLFGADHAPKNRTAAFRLRGMPPLEKCKCNLNGEGDAAPRHTKVIVGAIHYVPAEVTHPADVRGEANFEAGADLAEASGRAASVRSGETNRDRPGR